jgi:leucyl aminopeptidase
MKGDCAGAAAVVGAMRAIALLKPATPVRAYVALVENLIGPGAMLTGDVITTLDKHTVEIMNPDAEGRLILADALALACQEGAGVVIDIATLTGGVVAALGNKRAGVFATSTQLAEAIIRVGGASGERFWRLPLAEEYLPLLEGGIADLRNVASTPGPDATVAALFLREFITPRVSWIHLDIAGPGLGDGMDRGHVAGFGVGTLTRFVCSRG